MEGRDDPDWWQCRSCDAFGHPGEPLCPAGCSPEQQGRRLQEMQQTESEAREGEREWVASMDSNKTRTPEDVARRPTITPPPGACCGGPMLWGTTPLQPFGHPGEPLCPAGCSPEQQGRRLQEMQQTESEGERCVQCRRAARPQYCCLSCELESLCGECIARHWLVCAVTCSGGGMTDSADTGPTGPPSGGGQ